MQTGASGEQQLAVGHALERVFAWLRENREPAGLSASALSALSRIERTGSLRVTELSAREGLTQPGMTTLINRLEDAGYATRESDPEDGRAVRVKITPAGIDRVLLHRDSRATRIAARIAELPIDQQRALVDALEALQTLPTDVSLEQVSSSTKQSTPMIGTR
jgi:DNA-binding MarR family transcriptional regulator